MKEIDIRELKFGMYNRKSSDSEDKQVQSIATQERENSITAERSSLRLVNDAQYSETKSAFTHGRQVFAQMVRDIERAKINGILVVNPNRLARNSIDGATLIELMDRKKLLAIKTPSKVYFPTSTDKMMLAIEFIFSKKDSDDKSDFVKNGLKTKALKGLPSGVAHIGFLNDFSNEKGNRKWCVDEEMFPLLALLLRRFLEGDISASRLHRWAVKELKLTTPKHKKIGGALISRSRMYEILKDPIYAGVFFQDDVRYPLDISLPRIITEDQYNRIQQLLGAKCAPKTKSYLSPYTGFIKGADSNFIPHDPTLHLICDCRKKFAYLHKDACPACGKKIEDMASPKYLAYTFYYNVRRKKMGQGAKHIEERKVTSYLKKYIAENLTLSRSLADWSRKHIRELADKQNQDNEASIVRKTKMAKEFESRKARYREMLADHLITTEEYRLDTSRLQKTLPTPPT